MPATSRRWGGFLGFSTSPAHLTQTHKHIMKDTIISLVRHALTALVSVGALLSSRGMIAAEDVEAVNASGVTIRDAALVIIMAVITRLLMKFGGKLFSGDSVSDSKDKGLNTLLLFLGMAGLFMGLPSCTPQQMEAVKAVPIKACYADPKGNKVCYSSQDGIEVEVTGAK